MLKKLSFALENQMNEDDYGLFIDLDKEVSSPPVSPRESISNLSLLPKLSLKNLPRTPEESDVIDSSRRSSVSSEACTTVAADSVASGKLTSVPSDSSLVSMRMSCDDINAPELKVLCQVDDPQAPLSCRTFRNGRIARIAITGFRLVEENSFVGEIAEYRVELHLDGVCSCSWKRYYEFESLTNLYLELACELNRGPQVDGEGPYTMRNSRRSWTRVRDHHAASESSSKFTTMMIVKETSYLKVFLKHLLFEIPSLTHLQVFLSTL